MPPISFDQIPSNILTPMVTLEFSGAKSASGPSIKVHRILVIAQKLSTGTVPQLTLKRAFGADDISVMAGKGSVAHRMAKAHFANNKQTETWFIFQDDAGGSVAATDTITITGPATAPGTLALYIGGTKVAIAVANAAVQNDIATALAAAINLLTELPVTAGAAANVVTLTARNKGLLGNELDVRLNYAPEDFTPAGLTIVIADGVAGSGNPDVTAVWTILGEEQFDEWAVGCNDQTTLSAVDAELELRWGPMRQIEGRAFFGKRATVGAAATLGAANNSKHSTLMNLEGAITPSEELAASYCAQATLELQKDPARPLRTLPLLSIKAPAFVDRYTQPEAQSLLGAGIATYTVDQGGVVRIQRAVSLYKTNAIGAPDKSFRDIEVHATISYIRYDLRLLIATKYPRHKLGVNSTNYAQGQAIMTPALMRSEIIARASLWESLGLVQNLPLLKASLVVEINAQDDTRLDVLMPITVIKAFNVLAGKIEF